MDKMQPRSNSTAKLLFLFAKLVGQATASEATSERPQANSYPVARGNHSLRPPVKIYRCIECDTPMTKHGTGLGKWHCSNKAHNHSTYSQTRGPGGGDGKTVTERVRHRNCGKAYPKAA